MYHFFVPGEQIQGEELRITGEDVLHMQKVLRMQIGEQLTVSCPDQELEYRCEIIGFSVGQVTTRILAAYPSHTELSSRITLFQGLPKGDKMELIIQKAVELGVSAIVPVKTDRTIVKLDEKKEQTRRKRWNSISESAAKQSGRHRIPEVAPLVSFSQALQEAREMDHKLIPYEHADNMQESRKAIQSISGGESVAIFIGPEGGFSDAEIEEAGRQGFLPVTLGHRILRTETAGLMLLSVLMYQLEE